MNIKFLSYLRNLLLIIMLIPTLLLPAGCSGIATTSKDEDVFLGKPTAAIKNDTPTTIKIYFPGNQPSSWTNVKAEIEKKISGTVNATLDFKWITYQQYYLKMGTLDASEEPFDTFCLASPQGQYPDFTKLAREGKLKDISQLFPINAPSLKVKYTKEELRYGYIDGKQYLVPSLDPEANAVYLLLDDTLLRKYNMAEVTSLKQYGAYLKAVKEGEPDLIPGAIINAGDSLKLFAGNSGYVILDDGLRLVYKWDDPGMKVMAWEKTSEFSETVKTLSSWFEKGYLESVQYSPDLSGITSFVCYGGIGQPNKEATKTKYNSSARDIKETNPLRAFYLSHDNPVQRENPVGTFFRNGSFAFPSCGANTERALQFLDWVQSSWDNYCLMMCGIQGKDYVLDEKYGYPKMPDGMNYSNRTYMYWDGAWAFRNIEYARPTEDDTIKWSKQYTMENSKYPPHGTFYTDYRKLGSAWYNRVKKFDDFESKLAYGPVTEEIVEQLIKELDAIGTNNLLAEVQKQLDEALKARKK